MLNLDMVGRYAHNGLWTIGISTSADWVTMLDAAGANQLATHGDDDRLLAASDQFCYLGYGIPVLFFHTGLHAEYHTPSDDVALIDTDGMVAVGDLVIDVLTQLLVRPAPPLHSSRPWASAECGPPGAWPLDVSSDLPTPDIHSSLVRQGRACQ